MAKYKSGVWEGFYNLNGKKKELLVNFSFRKTTSDSGTIEGNGNDEILGFFNVQGTFSEKAPYPCDFNWKFPSNASADMNFSGWRESDKGGFFGQWKGTPGGGAFAFYPAKSENAVEAAQKLQQTKQISMKKELENMGFEGWLIDQALAETGGNSLEQAVHWLTSQSAPSSGSNTGGNDGGSDASVNADDLQMLVSMGFDTDAAREALTHSGGNVEAAANLLFDQ